MVPPAQLPDDIIAQEQPTAESEKKSILPRLGLIAGAAVLAYLVFTLLPYDVEARKGLALLTLIAILWLTEALHITITALLIPALAVIIGFEGLTTAKALSTFADPVIFLFFGGFALNIFSIPHIVPEFTVVFLCLVILFSCDNTILETLSK